MDDAIDATTNCPIDSDGRAQSDTPTDTPTDTAADECPDLEMRRIQDLLAESLALPNAFAANLGAQNSGLRKMAYRMQQAIEKALDQGPAELEEFEDVMPAIETLLKITKQVDRYSQLSMKLEEAQAAMSALVAKLP